MLPFLAFVVLGRRRLIVIILSIIVLSLRWLLWGGSQGPIRQLILGEVLAHFVQSIDGPESQLGHLDPPIVHRLRVHHDDHQVKAVLLE